MNIHRHTQEDQATAFATGWLLSCLLHGTLAIVALLFVQRLQLGPQSKSFQWDVAMIAPLSSTASTTSTAQHTVSQTTDTTPALKPVRQKMTAPPATALSEPAKKEFSEARQEQPPLIEQNPLSSLPSSMVAPSPSIESRQLSTSSTEPIQSVQDRSTQSEPQTHTDSSLDAPSSVVASANPTSQSKSIRVDYAWLSDLMARWIEDLNKRYPATLRTEGVQGKVTLAAMLHEDGLLSDVRVVKSSGNAALDQVALEDVKNGPPVTFSQPLERSKMSVRFSIVYDLKTIR